MGKYRFEITYGLIIVVTMAAYAYAAFSEVTVF